MKIMGSAARFLLVSKVVLTWFSKTFFVCCSMMSNSAGECVATTQAEHINLHVGSEGSLSPSRMARVSSTYSFAEDPDWGDVKTCQNASSP